MVYVVTMEHEPADFRPDGRETADDEKDEALDALLAAIPPYPGLPATPAEIAAAVARGRADVAAGRVVPHELVTDWLRTWGAADEKPMPREWLE